MTGAGRPRLPLGTAGLMRVYRARGGTGFVATAKVRDYDGQTRRIERTGKSKSAARGALAEAVRTRHVAGDGADITADTTVDVLAEAYYAALVGKRSVNTLRVYRDRIDNQVLPSLGGLRVRELTTGRIDRHLKAVAERNGPGTAKLTKTVLSGMLEMAARDDAVEHNATRSVEKITSRTRSTIKEPLTLRQAIDLRKRVHLDVTAVRRDLCDLIDFQMVTGLRIAEAIAIERDDFDLDAMTVRVGQKLMVRETGKGLYIERDRESTKLTPRTLEMPGWFVDIVRARFVWVATDVVFPSPKGQLRDHSNTSADVKEALTAAGYGWATSHTFRRTLASLMEAAGLGARAAADQLGHANISMTQDKYFGRSASPTGATGVTELYAVKG